MTGNLVGGNTTEKENVIKGSNGAAIEILEEALEPGSTTEISRNRGSANNGLFIDLKAGANEGIVSPAFSSAIQSKAEGTAEPGATIRVFRKASAEAGELQSFLAETEADASGNWKVSYGSVPAGTIIAATQTGTAGGTSELGTATTSADPVQECPDAIPSMCVKPPDACAFASTGCSGPPQGKPSPMPQTKILKGPKAKSAKTTAKFKFNSSVAGSSFQCKLDKKPFKKCRSPKTYKKLKPGKHVFKVRAVGPTGLVDKTPAKRKFQILP
jgi:hypothetical protein